eukprot:SAG31_NODE_35828_length_319_cov_0.945455_1_plen_83_part_01
MVATALLAALLLPAEPAAGLGPCDILSAGGNPCVAAHSTTRALYVAYAGPLYQVTRPAAGNATSDVHARAGGGWADSAAHDKF